MIKFYRIVFLGICTFFYSQNTSAQSDTAKAIQLKNKLTDSICICISKTDTNSVNNLKEVQEMLTKCIAGKMELYVDYLEAAGNDISKISNEKMQEIANNIASEVYNRCAAMKVMINHVNAKKE